MNIGIYIEDGERIVGEVKVERGDIERGGEEFYLNLDNRGAMVFMRTIGDTVLGFREDVYIGCVKRGGKVALIDRGRYVYVIERVDTGVEVNGRELSDEINEDEFAVMVTVMKYGWKIESKRGVLREAGTGEELNCQKLLDK